MIGTVPEEGLGGAQALPGQGNVVSLRGGFASTTPLRVLLVTEGTYPFHFGGVSTWSHSLIESLPDIRFSLMALVGDRKLEPQFAMPPNLDEFLPVSMWGTYDLLETRRDLSFSEVRRRRKATTESTVEEGFVPAFRSFLDGLLREELAPKEMALSIADMHRFFLKYDLDAALRSHAAWDVFGDVLQRHAGRFARRIGMESADYGLLELTRSMQWIYRWLFPLARPIPRVDVVHAAMAGLCTMVAVAAKREHGAGFLLTEHGIYLREAYLAAARSHGGWLLKMLQTSFARRMAELSYAWADQIAPVCSYNHRWEVRVGATRDRLRTMYYGVDSTRFQPRPKTSIEPVVSWVGRIDPLKDIHTLLRAAAVVHAARPDVRFRLYGAALPGTEDYHRSCLALQHELGLDEAVLFAGYIGRSMDAFNDSDVVVMSSISEAVPFSILEAMLCARPVVATAVGGIPEQLGECGVLVEPRNPGQMGAAILALMNDAAGRAEMGRAARERALRMFDMESFAADHRRAYRRIAMRPRRRAYTVPKRAGSRPSPRCFAGATAVTEAAAAVHDLHTSPPVDSLEVAALMESTGITDQIAAVRYGAADVFELADAALPDLRSRQWIEAPGGDSTEGVTGSLWARLRDATRVPLALVQAGLLLAVILAFAQFSGWPSDRVIALGLGMTTGILLVSVLIQALGRRASIYLGFRDRASAVASVDLLTVVAAAVIAAIALAIAVAAFFSSDASAANLEAFGGGFATLAMIWVAAAGPIVARAPEWLVLALAAAVGTIYAGHLWISPAAADFGLVAAAAFGLAGAVVLVGRRLSLRRRAGEKKEKAMLPSPGYLVHEAGPYLAYSALYMSFFILPHVLGWTAILAGRADGPAAIATMEHWLTLGLPPLLMATGLAEQASNAFWRRASEEQKATAGSSPGDFGRAVLRNLYVPQLARLTAVLALAGLATWLLIDSGIAASVSAWLRPPDGFAAAVLFAGTLVGFGLLGWGLFNFTYTLSLARPELAVKDLLPAIATALAVGIAFGFGAGFQYSVVGFAAGGLVLVLTSSRTTWGLLRSADYHYFASI